MRSSSSRRTSRCCGIENPDVVFRTAKEKYFAVADEIAKLHETGQPALVGTTSIEKSELLSQILQRKGVKHVVLNAKFHEREAEIVAQAGRLGMVTIATNMAGRGTDILLGGNAEFVAKQDLVKKSAARAISVAEGALNPMAVAGHVPLLLPGAGIRDYAGNLGQAPMPHYADEMQRKSMKRSSPQVACTSSALSGMSRGVSITSFADAPDARAIRAHRVSISRLKTT